MTDEGELFISLYFDILFCKVSVYTSCSLKKISILFILFYILGRTALSDISIANIFQDVCGDLHS